MQSSHPSYIRLGGFASACVLGLVTGTYAQQFQDQTAARFPTETQYSNQVSACDFDDDGDLDLAWANGGGFPCAGQDQILRLYVNDGSGNFTDETLARIGAIPGDWRGVEWGDMDGDGDWDLVFANDNNMSPRLLSNDGDGTFTDVTSTNLPAATLGSARAQFADVDNDGDLDLYFTNGTTCRFGTGQGRLYLNDGAGVYTDATSTNMPPGTVAEPQDCIFGDIDGDFDFDLRIGSTAFGQSKLYRNNGDGTFSDITATVPTDNNCYSYDFGDMDGDGDLDLLGANANTSPTNGELLLDNDGTGDYSLAVPQISPNPGNDDNDSKFFDMDNDGDLDLVVCRIFGAEKIYQNNGTGTYTQVAGAITSITDSSLDVIVADFTGDNRLDIVTAQGESGQFQNRIYVNTTGAPDSIAPDIIATEQVKVSEGGSDGPFVIRATIYDSYTSDRGFIPESVTLNYEVEGGLAVQVPMDWSGNSIWRGVIPSIPGGGVVNYFVTATDMAGNTGTGETLTFELPTTDIDGDLDGDGDVDFADLLALLAAWGPCKEGLGCPADLDGSGDVGFADLLVLLANWTAR